MCFCVYSASAQQTYDLPRHSHVSFFDVLKIVNCLLSQPALCGVKASLTITA